MSPSIAAPSGGEEAARIVGEDTPQALVSAGAAPAAPRSGFLGLALGSIGVVYGDIGTSPLYALREAVNAAVGVDQAATPEAVFGVLSLILWALIFIVTFKYVIVLLRADNNGEGGTLTLMALARKAIGDTTVIVVMLGIVGTRRPTPYGVQATTRLARDLANAGLCIASGMARGIDTAAHKAALEADGETIAVFGCGVDLGLGDKQVRRCRRPLLLPADRHRIPEDRPFMVV